MGIVELKITDKEVELISMAVFLTNIKKGKKIKCMQSKLWEENFLNANICFFSMGKNATIFENIEFTNRAKGYVESCLKEKQTWYTLFLRAYLNASVVLSDDDKTKTITLLKELIRIQTKTEDMQSYYIFPYILLVELSRDSEEKFYDALTKLKECQIEKISTLSDVFKGVFKRTYNILNAEPTRFCDACRYLDTIEQILFENMHYSCGA